MAATDRASALPADDSYLSDLLSYGVERLNEEPDRLASERQRAERRARQAAVEHYRAFVGAAECYATVRREVAGIERGLEAMRASLPTLRAGCEAFATEAADISRARAKTRDAAADQAALLDALEIPALQDTCVRHGNYDEALDLEAHVAKFVASAHAVPAARLIGRGAERSVRDAVARLLAKLRAPATLPECLRVVGHLRRAMRTGGLSADAYSDASDDEVILRRVFLRCRARFVRDRVDELDRTDARDFFRRRTDAARTHVFDVVTQYRAIFADEDEEPESSNAPESSSAAAPRGGPEGYSVGVDDSRRASNSLSLASSSLLAEWCSSRVDEYLADLEATLPRLEDGAALAAAEEHARYCATSLGRVGVDFRAELARPFERAAEAAIDATLDRAASAFERDAREGRWTSMPSAAVAAEQAAEEARRKNAEGNGGGSDRTALEELSAAPLDPPYALLEHPATAALCNGVLAALNDARHLVAHARLRGVCARGVRAVLRRAASAMCDAARRRPELRAADVESEDFERPSDGFGPGKTGAGAGGSGGSRERDAFDAAAEATADVLAPFLAAAHARTFAGVRGAGAGGEVDAEEAVEELRKMILARVGGASKRRS